MTDVATPVQPAENAAKTPAAGAVSPGGVLPANPGADSAAAQAAGVGETPKETPKHPHHERLSKRFPDKKFEKPEDYDGAMNDYLGELEGFQSRTSEANQKLNDVFEANPEVAEFMHDLISGLDPLEAFARNFDIEAIKSLDGEPNYKKGLEARTKRLEESRSRSEALKKNSELSAKDYEDFIKEKGLSPQESEAFESTVAATIEDLFSGKLSKTFWENMWKLHNYENTINETRNLAEVKARNEKITTEKIKDGDGLPHLEAAGEKKEEVKAPVSPIDKIMSGRRKQILP